jgi:tRNA(Ile)-lysidine synthase
MTASDQDLAALAARRATPPPPARVGIAVSGGPDSLAALALLAQACRARGVPAFALHVDHGLRPDRAAADRELVAGAARSLEVPFAFRSVDVPAEQARAGGSTEFVARILRHRALDELAAALALTHVVLAHHVDDQIETVLLSILRGAWPASLAGMPAERRMPGGALLVRPFLAVPKAALRTHAAPFQPAADEMNLDLRHRRVAVRERLLPSLRAVAAETDAAVLAVLEAARIVDDAALRTADRVLPAVVREPGVAAAPSEALRSAGRFGRARLVRRFCDEDPALGHATWALLREIERAAEPGARLDAEVRRGVRLVARDDVVALFTEPAAGFDAARVAWTGAAAGARLDASRALRVEPGASAPPGGRAIALALPAGAVIEARPRRARDRFALEHGGSKLVADELSDRRIHPAWRARVPLLFVDGVLRWIPGVRVVGPQDDSANAVVSIEGPMPWDRRL